MTVLFSDSGTGADANPAGGSFVTITGWAGIKRLSNSFANAAGSDGDCGARINVTTDNDQYVKIRPSVVGGRDFGPMLRVQSGAASGVLMTDYNATDVEVYVVVAGNFGSFVDRDTGTYQTTSDIYFEVQGSAYLSKIGATTINSFTDSTFASGQGGIFMYDSTARVINVEVGNFLTGGGAFTLTIGAISYSHTLQSVALRSARRLTIAPLSYSMSLQAVAVRSGRKISIAAVSYTLSLQNVGLQGPTVGFSLSIAALSYTWTLAPSVSDFAISIQPISYTMALQAVGTQAGRKIGIAALSYSHSLQPVRLAATRTLSMGAISYSMTLQAVSLRQTKYVLQASPISYQHQLRNVQLQYSGNPSQPWVIDRPFDPYNWWHR